MDELQKLYDVLVREGKYTKSFEEFVSQWKDEGYRTKVFDVVSRDGLYTKDRASFDQKYSGANIPQPDLEQLKKKGPSTSLQLLPGEKPSTESPSEGGSSVSQEVSPKFDESLFKPQYPTIARDATYVKPAFNRVEADRQIKAAAKFKAESAKELNARQIEEKKKAQEEEAYQRAAALNLQKTPEFQQKLKQVDASLIDKEEEEVVPQLNREFGRYGFTFEETGSGDAMIVRSFDGKHSIEIDLDPFTSATEVAESARLREFLNAYGREEFKMENEDFLSKAYKAKNLRTVGRRNEDGSESTVKMTSFEQDGKYYAIPTLFPKNPSAYSADPSTWQELPFEQALKIARERGEVFQFATDKEAKDFASGSWKDISTRDIEADKWYKERGLDYVTEKKRWEKYKELDDIIDFIEGDNDGSKEQMMKAHPELFVKGRIRGDIDQYISDLKKQRDALDGVVNDYGFFSDGKSEVARMDWDVELEKRQKKVAAEAIQINNQAKAMEYDLDAKSIQLFGVPAKELIKYKNTDPALETQFKELTQGYYATQEQQKAAATKFEIAKTYFDGKVDKQVKGEFKENMSAFWTATTDAYKNGLIGQQLLSFSMPGGKSVSSFKDRKEAAEFIASQYAQMSGTESRAMARWRNARGFSESMSVLGDDPIEIASTFVASSISQILPYGFKIVAATTATGAGAGAGAGLAGGPFAEVTVPGGAITGGVYGFRTGMAITSFATEYTNAVMEAVSNKGYNPLDPESLAIALSDESVWQEGAKIGTVRGLPIAVTEFVTAGLAGRVFKPASALASRGTKLAYGATERLVFDPAAEAAGELVAQTAELGFGTGRKEIGWKEIAEEGLGGLGSNTINYGFNTFKDIRNKNNVEIAQNLTEISNISSESASDEKITTWTNNMLQLKKIDADVAQRINENVGLRREAKELLEVGPNKKPNAAVVNRTMELLAARNELSSTQNRREIYRDKIKAINSEIATISETKTLLPEDKAVNLNTIIGTTRQGTSQYSIDGRRFTKEQFLEKVNSVPQEQLSRMVLGVKNDQETAQIIKDKYNAIQKSKTDAGVLGGKQSKVGLQEVGEGDEFEAAEGIREATLEDEKPKVLSTIENTFSALSSLPVKEKENITFTNENGEEVSINSNEKTAADLYHKATLIPEEERTATQQSIIDAIEVSLKTQIDEQKAERQKTPVVNVAPFFDTQVTSKADAVSLRSTPEYQGFIKGLNDLASSMGLTPQITDKIGGYKNDDGNDITEVSALVSLPGATIEQAEQFAALSAALTPDVQESSIAAQYTGKGEQNHNANEYEFRTDDVDGAIKALKEAGIQNFTADDQTGIITFTDVKDFADKELTDKIAKMLSLLNERNIYYDTESIKYRPVESRFIGKDRRKDVLRQVGERRSDLGQGRGSLREAFERAVEKDAAFQGITAEEYRGSKQQPSGPVAGNRLFNKPLKAVSEIADRYYERVFGKPRPKFFGTRALDKERAKRIADAYENLKNDPNNPEVRAAYEALAKETIEQYKAFLDAGYVVEVNNDEPYNNSQDMIEDLRNNKRIKIFSTESGFGDTPITDQQRQENPLLAKTEFTDVNGQPMLVNDLFRAVHDFYGHAELGNSFGEKGEENAWNVHVRMFSPLAARAMTTETRGQNSYVNSSGINEIVEPLRKQARELRKQGKFEEARPIVNQIYEIMKFADQKVGLLPEEFSNYDVNDTGDANMKGLSVSEGVNEMMKTDTSTPSNIEKVYNFLDNLDKGIDKFLKGGPNSATTAIPLGTMQVIVKAIKTLVKGGMMLKDAIKKVAADNNVSEADVISSLTIIDNMMNNVSEGLSEAELPGYDRMMGEVEGIIKKSNQRGVDKAKILDNVMKYVMGSKVYETATDVQREKLVRAVNKMFDQKQKSAPSVARLFGTIKDIKKITMSEKELLKKQFRDLARGGRDAKAAINKASTEVTVAVKKLASSGKITAKQAANVLRRFDKTNLLNQESVDRFIQYMSKVFENAEYADNLSKAKAMKSQISSLSRNQDKNANLRDLGRQFVQIDPSLVEDIEAYNEMASKIQESLRGSTIVGKKVNFSETVNIEDATKYINKTMKEQRETLYKYAADEVQELMGIDPKDLSYDDLMSLLEKDEPITKYNESIIRDTIRRMFDINASIIKKMIRTGVDAFTGDPVAFTKSQVDVVSRFMDMDLDKLSPKEALQAVDALSNFLQNKSTAKMESVVSDYVGKRNAEAVVNKGIKAIPLRKYWSKGFARLLAEQTTTLPSLFERMFKGVNRGGLVEDYSGFAKLRNNKSFAERQANNIANDYVKAFYDKKANGQAFNTEENNIERGMAAFMMRNVIGTESEMQAEFDRRKRLVQESIDVLREGNDNEKKKAEIYDKVYSKVLADSKTIQDIKDNTDPVNLDGINFWTEQWADKYEELADVSLNVYNKLLDKDINYNPDRFTKLSRETGEVELANNESAFHANNGTLYKKETGVLMKAVRPEHLPKNTKNGQAARYIDLSFDKNNANSMYDALVDIKTAAAVRQVEAFLNSPSFSKIVDTADDAKILKDRIQLYVSNIRNKNPYSNVDELSKTIRRLNKIAAVGVGQALGGITQPFKQVIPVAMNTLVNAGSLDMGAMFSASKNNFINNAGYAISNRGIESQAQIESINKLINLAAESKGEKALRYIEEANKMWLNIFLVKPDVFIARASWMTYYEKSLKEQGINPSDIDYDTHTVNEKAANYAQRMVDRQQNVSDTDLSGKLFADKNESKQVFVKMLMPFASFRMNQATRLANDLSVLGHWGVSTKEDKVIAARSLAGFSVEMVTFKIIAATATLLLGTAAKKIMGKEEDEEEYEKRKNNVIKGQMTSAFTDILSPLPILDKPVQAGGYYLMDKIQDMMGAAEDGKINIYNPKKEDYVKGLGLFGVSAERVGQFANLLSLAYDGKFKNEYNKDKWISTEDRDALKMLIVPALMSNIGLLPSEANSIVRISISDAKKDASETEGGKTPEDIELDEYKEGKSEEEKANKRKIIREKIDALEELRREALKYNILEEIDKQISILSMSEEDKKAYDKEHEDLKILQKAEYEALLQGYDNESDMKRYDKRLWLKTFGPNSDYYKEHYAEDEVKRLLNKILRKKEDEEYNYSAPEKGKRKESSWESRSWRYKKSSSSGDGSSFRSTKTVTDAEGNVISSSSYRRK